jgi:hypothetical protein
MHRKYRISFIFSLIFALLCEVFFIFVSSDLFAFDSLIETQQGVAISITPREIDFGNIRTSEGSKGDFVMKSPGSGTSEWSIAGPPGWIVMETQKLTGLLQDKDESIKVHISSLKEVRQEEAGRVKNLHLVQMTLHASNKLVSYQKRLTTGLHREMLKISFNGTATNIFVRFRLIAATLEPLLDVEPARIDLGIVRQGEQIEKRVRITNKGMTTLKWNISLQNDNDSGMLLAAGHYVSFMNSDVKGTGTYMPPQYLKDALDISGKWSEVNGYPSTSIINHILRYHFTGTGVTVLFTGEPDGTDMTAFIDEEMIISQECKAGPKERAECVVVEGLPYGNHTLTLAGYGTQLIVEGVKVYGKEVMKGPNGWINISPVSGTTNRETDYVNMTFNTKVTTPGYYAENIVFDSNGGNSIVEISLEVSEDTSSKSVDVYRYVEDVDYLYTSNPQEDSKIINPGGYMKEGVAFRLFTAGTPGTTPLYRWYHASRRTHYFSYYNQSEQGKIPAGYVLEGTIGNIGTSRLTNTRPLYRWFNPSNTSNFYTTDQSGEGHLRKGYRFEGIVGYVR